MFPSIEPSEVGLTGLFWLFFSYGYALYYASNLISEGSELLLLVPSLAGLVGGVVLPLLGAVPDGAIILFSGLGDLESAQETLSVGVGALAGSTIMLLTVPLSLSIIAGRVDILPNGTCNYMGTPKLSDENKNSLQKSLNKTGVAVTEGVRHGGIVMMITTLPYFLIQVPASFLTYKRSTDVAMGEHWFALVGLVICLTGLFFYMRLQLQLSKAGEDKGKRMAVVKKLLKKGQVSLSGAIAAQVREREKNLETLDTSEYQSLVETKDSRYPPQSIVAYLKEILADAFYSYDSDQNGQLDRNEVYVFFRDFHETIAEQEMDTLFDKFDTDSSGTISLDEFIGVAYTLIKAKNDGTLDSSKRGTRATIVQAAFTDDNEEGEEVPEEFTDLPPEQQQAAIKKRAMLMLSAGTFLVLIFSDPMVDVMQQLANRANLSPFYVSFILAPLASNASEVLSSMYYASKKTRKTMTVSLSALQGAACMNNTFCLSIFMGLIFVRGLAWHYTAETIAIVLVEFCIGFMAQKDHITSLQAVFAMAIFPLSIVLVAGLEHFGLD